MLRRSGSIRLGAVLIFCSAWCGCATERVIVAGDDQVTVPGRNVVLTAKVQVRSLFLEDIKNQPVEFHLVSAPERVRLCVLEKGRTDRDGKVRAVMEVLEAGRYVVAIRYPGDDRHLPNEDVSMVLAVRPGEPVVILDVDNTLTNENWLHRDPEPAPYDGDTVRVVNELARRYKVVYLSARPKPLHTLTRKWLAKYGFPEGPVLLWYPSTWRWLRPSKFKQDQLTALRRMGVNVVAGVSNTEEDIEAYEKAGILPIILGKRERDAVHARDWNEIGRMLLEKDGKVLIHGETSSPPVIGRPR